jgi:hypothetical protein
MLIRNRPMKCFLQKAHFAGGLCNIKKRTVLVGERGQNQEKEFKSMEQLTAVLTAAPESQHKLLPKMNCRYPVIN